MFVHLRVHSEYSLSNGIVRIPALCKQVASDRMPAVALTDQGNIFGAVKFYRSAIKNGIQPIIGCDLWVENPETGYSRVLFLVQNETGYRNLSHLITQSYTKGQIKAVPVIKRDWLTTKYCRGMIALSGGMAGRVGQLLLNERPLLAREEVLFWSSLFPERYYLEIQRIGQEQEALYNYGIVELAHESGIPVVATNHVHFLEQKDFMAHEAKTCINEGRVLADPRRPKRYTDQQYLKSADEMCRLFSDIPEAIENTIQIARRCGFQFTLGKYFLPKCPVPSGETDESYIEKLSRQGLKKRLDALFPDPEIRKQKTPKYEERLQKELAVIRDMGFPGYFLIVADFVQWSKDHGVPVGPGRGSGAGSLVAFALNITNLDPIAYELLFERFLNPERVSMPDFDIDFCMEDRDKVIRYVCERYGRDHVSQIITYGSMAAKAVVRDVGRVLGHPYGMVDKLAKLIPFDLGMTLEKAIQLEPELERRMKNEEDVAQIMEMAMSLEGLVRNAGKHAGGVVIAPEPIERFVPLYCEQDGEGVVSQFDKDDVEVIGLVKFDFLGLRTLTIIKWALENIRKDSAGKADIDIDLLPMDDDKVYACLQAGHTTAVFQLESRGMKELLKRLKPDCFEDIIALVALFRPGPLQSGMVDDFIDRKHGAKIEYPHPMLEPILRPTYGVILYQEQVMQIAREMAGYSLGGADLLRRAMGKKKPEEMKKQRDIFMHGAMEKGVDRSIASHVFDLMEKFAGYGFNKSHSAAYALLSYQTAWLKVNYPAEFMAAVLSSDMDNTDKVVDLVEECRRMTLEILAPDINTSQYHFSVSNGKIRYGLGAIKGVGQGVVDLLIAEREQHGRYQDLMDVCLRVDTSRLNRRTLESLIRAGALDSLGHARSVMMAGLEKVMKLGQQTTRNRHAGQEDLFAVDHGLQPAGVQDVSRMILDDIPEWSDRLCLQGEKETLGLYLTGHPFHLYEEEVTQMFSRRIADLRPNPDRMITVAGCVRAIKVMMTRKQERIAFVTLDDATGKLDAALFAKCYETYQEKLQVDEVLVVEGTVDHDDFSGGLRLRVEKVQTLDEARESRVKHLELRVSREMMKNGALQKLKSQLSAATKGRCPVFLRYATSEYEGCIELGKSWRIRPTTSLQQSLTENFGIVTSYIYA
ncbi:MAG: DNA polymerase III subunit alpha [Gammaproteobacteria bacterium]|nr:MAG: DNA polymerase III subunit alpha [Gammaproteobacteria bacterium]